MLTNAAASASSPNIRAQNNGAYEEMKHSQHNSEVMKRSMTVIQEEDYEESALAVSHLGFNSHLGKGSPMRRIGQGLNNTTMSRSGNLHNYSQTAKVNTGSLNQFQKDDSESNLKSAHNLHNVQQNMGGLTQMIKGHTTASESYGDQTAVN